MNWMTPTTVLTALALAGLVVGCEAREPASQEPATQESASQESAAVESERFSSIGTVTVGGEAGLLLGAWMWDSRNREACLYVVQSTEGGPQTGVECVAHPEGRVGSDGNQSE